MRVLYVTYDGMFDQLGQSQILPYLKGLSELGHRFDLLSFEKPKSRRQTFIPPEIRHSERRYHKTPAVPATAWDLAVGAASSAWLSQVRSADLVHARSYIAAAMALPSCRILGKPLVFDMRGLWVDERIDSGAWAGRSLKAVGARQLENLLLHRSSHITVLTNAMATYLEEVRGVAAPIHVIPTCADLDLFHPKTPPSLEVTRLLGGRRALVYLGAIGARIPVDALVQFYAEWKEACTEDTCFLIISREAPTQLAQLMKEKGLFSDQVHLAGHTREAVAHAVRCSAAGVFAYKEGISTQGISPTKLGEILACGIPCAGNRVGDVGEILPAELLFCPNQPQSIRRAARSLAKACRTPSVSADCRSTAVKWYALESGVRAYDELYRKIAQRDGPATNLFRWPPKRPDTEPGEPAVSRGTAQPLL